MAGPVKPIYGVMDFHAQLVIPMSKNPPVDPIDGSVYIDEDDLRLYAFVLGQWRASKISAIAGDGIHFEVDDLGVTTISRIPPLEGQGIKITRDASGVSAISVAGPLVETLPLQSPWTVTPSTPAPQRLRTASGMVQLRGSVQAPGPLNKPITILPVGWRPSQTMVSICVAGSGQQNLEIWPDGTVVPVNGTGSPTRLGGVTFIADAVYITSLPAEGPM